MNKNWKYYWKDGAITNNISYNNILHREDGPAIETPNGATHWEFVYNGDNHNLNGPAVVWRNGSLGYFLNGKFLGENLSINEFKNKIKEIVFK